RAMDQQRLAQLQKLGELIQNIRVAMLTTVDPAGWLHTRPVETLRYEPSGSLWFFTDWHSEKANELLQDVRTSVAYAHPSKNIYVAVAGSGRLSRDPAKAAELWTPSQRAWYPNGVEDERLAVLRVDIEHAEYWIAPGRASYTLAAVRAWMTGEPCEVGENRRLR
ncbi:MAG TPA: pyridoxamine 5'-phosphate oxidase family protein, partial [Steroidobacteraceae bacterium]|nr:pyridoxamine 5'-phosphate oxidase family protein [Steroidobacteraceae bacterium]